MERKKKTPVETDRQCILISIIKSNVSNAIHSKSNTKQMAILRWFCSCCSFFQNRIDVGSFIHTDWFHAITLLPFVFRGKRTFQRTVAMATATDKFITHIRADIRLYCFTFRMRIIFVYINTCIFSVCFHLNWLFALLFYFPLATFARKSLL